MPLRGKRWRHVNFHTRGTWLPGDPRGWRSRKHKRHSSGDYKQPPPEGEHQGLHEWSKERSGDAVVLPEDVRPLVAAVIVHALIRAGHRVLAVSVGAKHTHLLAELPDNIVAVRRVIGDCKSLASRSIRRRLPGRVWAALGDFEPVNETRHQGNAYRYILRHVKDGAFVWSYREPLPPLPEIFERRRRGKKEE